MSALVDLAESLTMDEIPIKLRCAACNKLANNAFRMPCCDQSICETCQASLPQACPVCLHEPVKGDDCRPNKALRTTIKVFLRKKGIEREAAQKKESANAVVNVPSTPTIPNASQVSAAADRTQIQGSNEPSQELEGAKTGIIRPHDTSHVPQLENDLDRTGVPQIFSAEDPIERKASSEEPAKNNLNNEVPRDNVPPSSGVRENDRQQPKTVENVRKSEQLLEQSEHQGINPSFLPMIGNGGFGYDGMNGGFPNMGLNASGDFSQIMQMMPNGMQVGAMGSLPSMIGLPGMGMDPMTMSQSMYGGFGIQGMGMNGMNVGMGFNGGQGAYGGFNGQPTSWNASQDKFNQNAYGSHSTGLVGDFGANAGFGGYNIPQHQGNFNQMHHQYQNLDFQNGFNSPGFHNRGRGRGRGYPSAIRGRAGHNQIIAGNQANYEPFHQQMPQQLPKQDPHLQPSGREGQKSSESQLSPAVDPQKAPTEQRSLVHGTDEQLAKELQPGDADDAAETPSKSLPADPVIGKDSVEGTMPVDDLPAGINQVQLDLNVESEEEHKPSGAAEILDSSSVKGIDNAKSPKAQPAMMPPPIQAIPLGPAAYYASDQSQDQSSRGRVTGRNFFRGSSDFRGMRGRGSGFHSDTSFNQTLSASPSAATSLAPAPPVEPKGLGVQGAPKAPKALREGLPNTGIRGGRGIAIAGRASISYHARPNGQVRSRSPSPARSRSLSRHRSHRRRSHRYRSSSSSEDRDRERRRDRHRHHSRKYEDDDNGKNSDVNDSYARDRSADSSGRRSAHRSHRDHKRSYDEGRSSHRSHRSHRDRSRERDGENRASRKRSRSRSRGKERYSNRVAEVEGSPSRAYSHQREKQDDSSQSSRKKREREDENGYREQKRSKRGSSPKDEATHLDSNSRHSKYGESSRRSDGDSIPNLSGKRLEKSNPDSSKSEIDPHTLEREARNKERLLRELQRREAMEGSGLKGKTRDSKLDARGGTTVRRVNYKYEDEERNEARASVVESEREASRWR